MWETRVRSLGWEDSLGGRHGNPLQYSCLENPLGQRSLTGYSPWGSKELHTTEQLSTALSLIFVSLIIMCLSVFLLGFTLPESVCASWTWLTVSFLMLGKFSGIISSNIFSGPFSFLLLGPLQCKC